MQFLLFYSVQQARRQNNLLDQTAKINGSQNYGFYSIF